MRDKQTGIDDLDVYASTLAIDHERLAAGRGFSPEQQALVGFRRRSITPEWEDPVTLAANAARGLVEEHGAERFGLLLVATETALDFGKPLSSWVHGLLGLPSGCRNLEVKHACHGGTAAVQLARAWVASPAARGRAALVIATDIARRHAGELPELTAGTGAVAMVVSAAPRLLRLDDVSGVAAQEVHDVSRPGPLSELADPVLSLSSYLDLVENAHDDLLGQLDADALEDDHLVFHAPLISLVRQAHATLLEKERGFPEETEIAEDFERRVAPTLGLNREISNVYSGSVWVSLASLLLDVEADARRVAIFSYGSGACAEWLRGRIVEGACARLRARAIRERMDARRLIDLERYEELVTAGEDNLVAPNLVRRPEGPGFGLLRVERHVRTYGAQP